MVKRLFFFYLEKNKQTNTNFQILTQNHGSNTKQKFNIATPTIKLLKLLFLALLVVLTIFKRFFLFYLEEKPNQKQTFQFWPKIIR